MVASRGPVPKEVVRRRNKRPDLGHLIAEVRRPAKPQSITGEAAAEWRRIVPDLERMGLLTTVDRGVLIRYCTAWADWVDVDRQLRETGRLIKGQRNGLVRNPLWMLRQDAESVLSDLGKQLGLTPNARLRAGVKHEESRPATEDDGPTAIDIYKARLQAK
jgi:P27 family predicted phage terminase small subunit